MASRVEYIDKNLDKWTPNIDLQKLEEPLSIKRFCDIFSCFSPVLDDLRSTNLTVKKNIIRKLMIENEREFMNLLLHTGQDEVALAIEPTVVEMFDLSILDPSLGAIRSACKYVDINVDSDILVKTGETSGLERTCAYKMMESPRGYFIIINNYFTFGTFKEMLRFRNIFFQLHFEVIVKKNLSAEQIWKLLLEMRDNIGKDNSHEAFGCMIITHGNCKNQILGFEDSSQTDPIDINTLCNLFNDDNCPNLKSKPRMFFFNCCRGDQDIKAITEQPSQTLAKSWLEAADLNCMPNLPQITDFLICYSTLEGYKSYVNWENGTVIGEILSDMLIKRSWDRNLNGILIRANKECKEKVKHPFVWTQGLTGELYFNPSYPKIKTIQH